MTNLLIDSWLQELNQEIESISNFWISAMPDHENSGFLAGINSLGEVDRKGSKGLVLNARILWTFSTLSISDSLRFKPTADRAYNYIITHFKDPDYRGYFWSVDQKGNPNQTRKQIYAHAFLLYGMTAYYKVSKDQLILDQVFTIFEYIEEIGRNQTFGGYCEAFNRNGSELSDKRLSDKDLNEPLSLNTHLHIIESYTSLYRLIPDAKIKSAILHLQKLFQDYILKSDGHLNMFLNADWKPVGSLISYGHDIEACWLLQESIECVHSEPLATEISNWIAKAQDVFYTEGILDNGTVRYEFNPSNNEDDRDRHWWVQAESMVGLINAYNTSGNGKFLESAYKIWGFILNSLKEPNTGEWYWKLDQNGNWSDNDTLAGFWKGPYHSIRACLESIKRLKQCRLES